MGGGPEQIFHQRRHTNGQPTHEKMLNIINHSGKCKSKPHMRYHLTSVKTAIIKIKQQITSVGEDVEKGEPSCNVDGNVNW